ncbi:MAG: non-homologous end joining protein Ku [Planctomycetota bacterium]|jgi:DNA end-binding protein Ku
MPPRATWKGHLKLSLVTIAVRVYNATSSTGRITLNQLHKGCHHRLRQQMVCPAHGNVDRSEIVKGYQYEKDRYVVIDQSDLERIQLETTKAIEIIQFIDPSELEPIYLDAPYYLAPDGPVAEESFRVIREAMGKAGKVGIGRFIIGGREHIVALQVQDRGLVLTTLRSAEEVRSAGPYFEEIPNGEVEKSQLKLAEQLVESMTAPLDTARFKDRYQEALLEIVKAKIEGTEPVIVQASEPDKAFNFMEALRASVAEGTAAKATVKAPRKKPPAKSVRPAARKRKKA